MATAAHQNSSVTLEAEGIYYRELNQQLRRALESGAHSITLRDVCGQRYIGTNLHGLGELNSLQIDVEGTAGNDLGAFLDGPVITVHGNAQDGCGNTMNSGRIVVHGRAGDIAGFAARGGEIFIRDDVGYRVGIHMKEYQGKAPLLVVGGWCQDFLGEYMAGGAIVLLDLHSNRRRNRTSFIGSGMHGGSIYVRGTLEQRQVGRGVAMQKPEGEDWARMQEAIREYGRLFGVDVSGILNDTFTHLCPESKRPYGRLYAY